MTLLYAANCSECIDVVAHLLVCTLQYGGIPLWNNIHMYIAQCILLRYISHPRVAAFHNGYSQQEYSFTHICGILCYIMCTLLLLR